MAGHGQRTRSSSSCSAGGLPSPGRAPYVRLTAPSGAIWEWNDPDDENRVEGSAAETGKPVGADAAAGKATFVSILGAERARAQAGLLVEQAVAHLDLFEQRAELLRQVARFVVNR